MLTTEEILGYLSAAIALITIVFSAFMIVKEIKRPKDPFENILSLECTGKFIEAGENILSESDIDPVEGKMCFLSCFIS